MFMLFLAQCMSSMSWWLSASPCLIRNTALLSSSPCQWNVKVCLWPTYCCLCNIGHQFHWPHLWGGWSAGCPAHGWQWFIQKRKAVQLWHAGQSNGSNTRESGKKKWKGKCNNCGWPGHWAHECQQPKKDQPANNQNQSNQSQSSGQSSQQQAQLPAYQSNSKSENKPIRSVNAVADPGDELDECWSVMFVVMYFKSGPLFKATMKWGQVSQ